jgi:hypothetical protein
MQGLFSLSILPVGREYMVQDHSRQFRRLRIPGAYADNVIGIRPRYFRDDIHLIHGSKRLYMDTDKREVEWEV